MHSLSANIPKCETRSSTCEGSATAPHTVFHVHVSLGGDSWTTLKRFSDFRTLLEKVTPEWALGAPRGRENLVFPSVSGGG